MRTCKWCGAQIADNRTAEYCNTRCYQAAWRKARRAEQKPKDECTPKTRLCRMCGKEFIPNQKARLYCSWDCRLNHDALKAEKPKPVTRPPDLDGTLKELNAYNQAHGTLISYGQWMGGVRA